MRVTLRPVAAFLPFLALAFAAAPALAAPPDTMITLGPPAFTNSTSATFNFNGTATATRFECDLDGLGFGACPPPSKTYPGPLSETTHTFSVKAFDGAGAQDLSPATHTWTVDLTPPDTSLTNGPPGVSGTTATWQFDSTQANSTFQCSLDGLPYSACTSPKTYSNLTQGLHIVQVKATDPAGNTDSSAALGIWTVDATAPETTLSGAPSGTVAQTSATLTFDSSEANSSFLCSLGGAPFSGCTTPLGLSGLADGMQSFQVKAVDAYGNTDPTPASANWIVDSTPPETTITKKPADATKVTSASFEFTSSEAASTFECKLDGAAFTACTSAKDLASLPEGTHTFQVRALDGAGPDPTPASHTWRVDTTAPKAPSVSIGPGTAGRAATKGQPVAQPDPTLVAAPFAGAAPFQTQNGLKIAWSSSDPNGGQVATYDVDYYVSQKLGGQDWPSPTNWKKETSAQSGFFVATTGKSYCFTVRATDSAGNTSDSSAYACTSIPVRSKDLDHSASWSKKTGAGHYFNDYSEGSSGLLKLTGHRDGWPQNWAAPPYGGIVVKRAMLLATRCPSCGKVKVVLTTDWDPAWEGSLATYSKTIDLKSATTKPKQKISLWTFKDAIWTETLTLNISVISSGKPVRIEGVGISPM